MLISFNKATDEIEKIFRTTKIKSSIKSYWDTFADQVDKDGVWDEKLIESAKGEIKKWLGKHDKKSLVNLWEQSESAVDSSDDGASLKPDKLKDNLSDDLLNVVLDRLGNSSDSDDIFATSISKKKKNEKAEDDDEDFGYQDRFSGFSDDEDMDEVDTLRDEEDDF
ncbi:MAG: hypothetical protein V1720_19190 [bacterium]